MIDIVLTNYNREAIIVRAIKSVFNQTYKKIHLIIVDDCSTDNSVKVIEDLLNSETYSTKVTFIKNKINVGAGVSRGIGIKYLKGKYMTFLDSDDYLQPDFIEQMYSYTKNKKYDIIGSKCTLQKGDLILEESFNDLEIPNKFMAFYYNPFLNGSLIKNKLWKKVEYSYRRFIEDTPTYFKLVYYAKNIICTGVTGYIYTQDSSDSLCKKASTNDLRYALYRLVTLIDEYDFLRQNKDTKLSYIFNKRINEILESENPLELLKDNRIQYYAPEINKKV